MTDLQGTKSDAYLEYVSDEKRRRLVKFARPKGSSKMADFFVAPPWRVTGHAFVVASGNRLIFELLKLTLVRIPRSWALPYKPKLTFYLKHTKVYAVEKVLSGGA